MDPSVGRKLTCIDICHHGNNAFLSWNGRRVCVEVKYQLTGQIGKAGLDKVSHRQSKSLNLKPTWKVTGK